MSWRTEILNSLDPQDFPEPYNEMAELIGVQNAVKVFEIFEGQSVYFLKLDKVVSKRRNELIRKQYDGFNALKLAQKYGLSVTWIKELVKEEQGK